jgi:biotin transport system substrate-specific component
MIGSGGSQNDIRTAVTTGVFAALIIAGSYIIIPLPMTPVPMVLQSMFVLTAGLVLGPKLGLLTVALYLGMGAIGLPVFAGGRAGPAHFLGPTAGYLVGYLPAVFTCGALSVLGRRRRSARTRRMIDFAAALAGTAVVYAVGVPVLARVTGMGLAAAISAGAVPFIPGDLLKVVVAAGAADRLRGHLFVSPADDAPGTENPPNVSSQDG